MLIGARSSFVEPLTPLLATVVSAIELWLVGSLSSRGRRRSVAVRFYRSCEQIYSAIARVKDGHGAHSDWLAQRVRYPQGLFSCQ